MPSEIRLAFEKAGIVDQDGNIKYMQKDDDLSQNNRKSQENRVLQKNSMKSTLSREKISNERNALPKTDKNSAKQGTSTVADADKIEVSRGQYEKMKANLESDKVYSKREVVETLDAARGLLSKKEGR